jgi:hypothetical protein
MKLSRKVGRRSHSSISRRRLRNKKTKSGYKKKYAKTQKGGKRGRSYKRVRTHKRGRRFHRGGFNCDSLNTISYGDRRIYYGNTPMITYNKKGFPEFSSIFKVCFEIKFMANSIVRITIIFTREPTHGKPESESPTFVFTLECKYSDVIHYLGEMLEPFTTDHITESDEKYNIELGILQKKPNVKLPLRLYRFTSQNNTIIFKNIIDCIKIKLKQYFQDKYPELVFDDNFNPTSSATQVNSDSGSDSDSSFDYTGHTKFESGD